MSQWKNTQPVKDEIKKVKAAYEVLKPFVDQQRYLDYLNGLIAAQAVLVDAREEEL